MTIGFWVFLNGNNALNHITLPQKQLTVISTRQDLAIRENIIGNNIRNFDLPKLANFSLQLKPRERFSDLPQLNMPHTRRSENKLGVLREIDAIDFLRKSFRLKNKHLLFPIPERDRVIRVTPN